MECHLHKASPLERISVVLCFSWRFSLMFSWITASVVLICAECSPFLQPAALRRSLLGVACWWLPACSDKRKSHSCLFMPETSISVWSLRIPRRLCLPVIPACCEVPPEKRKSQHFCVRMHRAPFTSLLQTLPAGFMLNCLNQEGSTTFHYDSPFGLAPACLSEGLFLPF